MLNVVTAGFDGSAASMAAVHWAAREAHRRGAVLRIMSCLEIHLFSGDPCMTVSEIDHLRDERQSLLDDVVDQVRGRWQGLTVEGELKSKTAKSALIEAGRSSDLLVVGAFGLPRAIDRLVGGTTRVLTRQCQCTLVVVPEPAEDCDVRRVVVGVDGTHRSDGALRFAADEADLHDAELFVVHGWRHGHVTGGRAGTARDITRVDAGRALARSLDLARERCGGDVAGVLVESTPATSMLDTIDVGDLLVVGSRRRGSVTAAVAGSDTDELISKSPVPIVIVH